MVSLVQNTEVPTSYQITANYNWRYDMDSTNTFHVAQKLVFNRANAVCILESYTQITIYNHYFYERKYYFKNYKIGHFC